MPELPEVETTKRSLQPLLGKTVANIAVFQPTLRWPVPGTLAELTGYRLQQVQRRAKYLILTFSPPANLKSSSFKNSFSKNSSSKNKSSKINPSNNDLPSRHQIAKQAATPTELPSKSLIIHLGMSGSLQQYPLGSAKRKHDHLIFEFNPSDANGDSDNNDKTGDGGTAHQAAALQLHYHDPRRFGAVLWLKDYGDKLLNHLGVEPLDASFTGAYLYQRIHRIAPLQSIKTTALKPITRPIKAVIMDQAIVVGVGNIYATESLFLAGIHPSTPAHLLSKSQLASLTLHIIAILQQAIAQGGSTLKDFTVGGGETGYFQQTLNVYGKYKSPCHRCNTQIDKVTITGRASTFCPTCQPLPNN